MREFKKRQSNKSFQLKNIIFDLLFYLVLILMVVISLKISGKNSSGPRVFGGYSAFVVLTGSMEEVIPKGSLVLTKSIDPAELQIGDDITYMVSESTTVTHRIIEIQENYLGTGERAFRTQGVMNKEPDVNLVAAVNVVGKVIYHNKFMGAAVSFGQKNWPLITFFVCVLLFFAKTVEFILNKDKDVQTQNSLEHLKDSAITDMQTIQDEDGFVLEIIEL